MLDRLPLEILDHVLDLLPPSNNLQDARDRRKALHSCTLVSKKVSERAGRLLIRDVFLSDGKRAKQLETRLQDDRTLASAIVYVRSLDGDLLFPLSSAQMSSLLGFLSSVRLFSWNRAYLHYDGNDFDDDFDLRALQGCTSSPSLRSYPFSPD
jgi:hypothetical protein